MRHGDENRWRKTAEKNGVQFKMSGDANWVSNVRILSGAPRMVLSLAGWERVLNYADISKIYVLVFSKTCRETGVIYAFLADPCE